MAVNYFSKILGTTLIVLVVGSALIRAMPPPNPFQCNQTGCILYNAYGVWDDRKTCHVTTVVYPTTEEELRSAVANANKNKLKVKVVSKFSHTITKLACPTAGNENAVLISTERYNSSIAVDVASLAVTVDAGVGLRPLIDRVEEEGLSLVAATYWEGVSVGGAVSTGAHGSSWWGKGGAIHDHLIGVRLIVPANASEGFARVLDLKGDDPLLDAARVSLGVLGVTLSLQREFKRIIALNFTNDKDIEDEFMEHGKRYEFGDIQWYPSRYVAVYRYDDRLPLNTSGDGVFDFIGFRPILAVIPQTVRALEKAAEATKSVEAKCILATLSIAFRKLIANGLKNNNYFFTGYPVIGHQGKMQTAGSCLYSPPTDKYSACVWDPRIKGLFFYESSVILTASTFANFIRDVKKLRDMNPKSFCGVDMYDGQPEDSVAVDFNYYRADDASTPRLNGDVWEEVEQMAFFKYSGKPHWAKNRKLAFVGVQNKYPNYSKFVGAKNDLDPDNMFSSKWSDEVLMLGQEGEGVKEDGCALEGQCVCSEDRHCSPGKGYFCRRGLVYKEARGSDMNMDVASSSATTLASNVRAHFDSAIASPRMCIDLEMLAAGQDGAPPICGINSRVGKTGPSSEFVKEGKYTDLAL
ncbi:L-gulonolactone oxidase 3 [Sesamum alatum]|uniref:L-gulonolactone oxidase n=1 Tax=Sesamum alatum TaxID=300844 RepID=A0AAE2CF97_9LAMI|nr:L-gulonolactone oxidase 3 [Sesamum alatum]